LPSKVTAQRTPLLAGGFLKPWIDQQPTFWTRCASEVELDQDTAPRNFILRHAPPHPP
jgi:hypothetical protein